MNKNVSYFNFLEGDQALDSSMIQPRFTASGVTLYVLASNYRTNDLYADSLTQHSTLIIHPDVAKPTDNSLSFKAFLESNAITQTANSYSGGSH